MMFLLLKRIDFEISMAEISFIIEILLEMFDNFKVTMKNKNIDKCNKTRLYVLNPEYPCFVVYVTHTNHQVDKANTGKKMVFMFSFFSRYIKKIVELTLQWLINCDNKYYVNYSWN